MTLKTLQKAPFPWFGGKSMAAPLVWELLGDVEHYVEPFAGSLAVLLNRPHVPNRPNYSETVNDLDGLVVNAWRSIQWHPEETAGHASWPVTEADRHARNIALVNWRADGLAEKLAGSAKWCDTEMAGWWLWGSSISIEGFCERGSWTVGADGKMLKLDRKIEGWSRPGVTRSRPLLSNNGQGINNPGTREPGLVSSIDGEQFHNRTMPELLRWFDWLSARLRHVRILNGDWARALTPSASKTINVRMGDGRTGIFLDPPYADTAGRACAYSVDDLQVAHVVKRWCAENGNDPDYRIVLAGFEGEHDDELDRLGWTTYEWFTNGPLKGGIGNQSKDGTQQHRERLWASPNCFTPGDSNANSNQLEMFADE